MRKLHMLHSLNLNVGDLGVNVRRINNWFGVKDGDLLELCVCTKDPETHKIEGHGKIEFLEAYNFRNIPARLLEFEHEEMSRRYFGLLESMRRDYGKEFNEHEQVLVIGYRRVD